VATKIALYRIVQEALNNAWRHAPEARAEVTVAGANGQLLVEVADEGVGFDPAQSLQSDDHLGLVAMRERAESLGGEFRIESAPDRGTRVSVTLPLEPAGGDDV
jgi:signal transduction histidine kinase